MVLFALCDMLDLAHVNPLLVFTLTYILKRWYEHVIVEAAKMKVGRSWECTHLLFSLSSPHMLWKPQFIFPGSLISKITY